MCNLPTLSRLRSVFGWLALAIFAASAGLAQGQVMAARTDLSPMAKDLQGLDIPSYVFGPTTPEDQSVPGRVIILYYKSGPWKGGRAVIECARDKSYAEIRIYDTEGNLVRIYSRKAEMRRQAMMAKAQQSGAESGSEAPAPPSSSGRSRNVESQVAMAPPPAAVNSRGGQIENSPAAENAVPSRTAASSARASASVPAAAPVQESAPQAPSNSAASASRPPPAAASPSNTAPASTSNAAAATTTGTRHRRGSAHSQAASGASAAPAAEPVSEPPVESPAVAIAPNQHAASSAPEPVLGEGSAAPNTTPPLPTPVNEDEQIRNAAKAAKQADAQQGLQSDSWTPKTIPAASPEPDMVVPPPKATRSVGRGEKPLSEEDQMQNAVRLAKKSSIDSDAWTPKSVALPHPEKEPDLSFLDKIKPPPEKPKIKSDVGNPEEGVMPVNSFEKFEGPMYGRHRELERRVIYTANPHAPVKGYDFYVDEVNRKEEYHYVYYYKFDKNKKPKLIAVEKHEHVTFLSNYDVDGAKEGKGKVSIY